jgi:hypothetical protein
MATICSSVNWLFCIRVFYFSGKYSLRRWYSLQGKVQSLSLRSLLLPFFLRIFFLQIFFLAVCALRDYLRPSRLFQRRPPFGSEGIKRIPNRFLPTFSLSRLAAAEGSYTCFWQP